MQFMPQKWKQKPHSKLGLEEDYNNSKMFKHYLQTQLYLHSNQMTSWNIKIHMVDILRLQGSKYLGKMWFF